MISQARKQTKASTALSSGFLQRKCSDCKKKRQLLQRRAVSQAGPEAVPPIVHEVLRSPGRQLDRETREFMEPRFGHDFSQIQVHTGEKAAESTQAVNALAYTIGHHIVFNNGYYAPHTSNGQRLLVHELTHVLQQTTTGPKTQSKPLVGNPGDADEREADQMADRMLYDTRSEPIAFARAGALIQRACGIDAIGTPVGCTPDAPAFISESRPPFKFIKNCDDLSPGEEARMKSFATTLVASSSIEIHGFASMDGDATYNENLSCARALKAKEVLTSPVPGGAGIDSSRITGVFRHGPTPGPAAERRIVVIRSEGPTPIPPGPAETITSQTVATSPGARTRTTIGVGEEVILTHSPGSAAWRVTGGTLSAGNGRTVILTAPDIARRVFVRAGAATISFDVIAPTSVAQDRLVTVHSLGHPDSGIVTRVFLGLHTVNFHKVKYRELDVTGVGGTGVYSCNTFSGGHCNTGGGGSPCRERKLTGTVVRGKGTLSELGDCAYSGDPVIRCGAAAPFVPGSVTLNIPYEYNVGAGAFRHFRTVAQVHTLESDASTLTSSKAGASGSTTVAAATVTFPHCP